MTLLCSLRHTLCAQCENAYIDSMLVQQMLISIWLAYQNVLPIFVHQVYAIYMVQGCACVVCACVCICVCIVWVFVYRSRQNDATQGQLRPPPYKVCKSHHHHIRSANVTPLPYKVCKGHHHHVRTAKVTTVAHRLP